MEKTEEMDEAYWRGLETWLKLAAITKRLGKEIETAAIPALKLMNAEMRMQKKIKRLTRKMRLK